MGVYKTTYLIYGFVLNKEQNEYVQQNWSRDHLPLIEYVEGRKEAEGHALLVDFMSGTSPTVFGKVIYDSSREEDERVKKIAVPNSETVVDLFRHKERCFAETPFASSPFEEGQLLMVEYYS